MALTQTQIIQSLGEALTWFEKELSWGVRPADLPHLTGRIGELYAAMITRGQMAPDTNQRGYDVVGDDGQRISVKTVTTSNHVTFRDSTLHVVNRVMILRLNVSPDDGLSIESILDKPIDEALSHMVKSGSDWRYAINMKPRETQTIEKTSIATSIEHDGYEIQEFESGTILVYKDGAAVLPARPVLRQIATSVGVPLEWETGTEKNTRQLGSDLIRHLQSQRESRVFDALAKLKPLS